MADPKCENCGAGVDVTPDGTHGHCATCNNIIELEKGSSKDGGEAKEGEAQSGGKDSSNEA
ncbi:hypothetical protein WHR41_07738 [Cladosporium halotolerans]|uniref:Uncharacterized protein n=1 Tax=Cladosporium halotolerans TaxID=1052096 RepID=A0AB34KF10_9PEZI